MTVKTFIKTTVLSIAFCSMFCMNNSMAIPDISLQNIFNKLSTYYTDYNEPIDL